MIYPLGLFYLGRLFMVAFLTEESILTVVSFLAVVVFSLVIFFSFRINRYIQKHRNRILSLFGGIVAAYVFLDLLPSLEQSNMYLKQLGASSGVVTLYEDAIFLVVFLGFLLFFSLEYFADRSIKKPRSQGIKPVVAEKRLYIVHFVALAVLDFVLSFLLVFQFQYGIVTGLLFTFAISLHLFIADNSMAEDYADLQIRKGRYIATAIPFIGWIASIAFPERIAEAYVLLAFISGSILYQSIKDEIPTANSKSSLAFFIVGAVSYSAVLIGYSIL